MASSPEGSRPPAQQEVRWPLVATIGVALAVVTVLGGVIAAVVAAFLVDREDSGPVVVVEGAVDPVAPAALRGTSFLYAERTTGRIVQVDADGDPGTLASVPDRLRTDGQRGVLGLAVRDAEGGTEVYASWTRGADGRIVVGRVAPGEARLVWEGPVSSDVANGGALAFRGDDLLVGIGGLDDAATGADPETPNGKVLVLDPDAGPEQQPGSVLMESTVEPWHDPSAMTVVGDDVWLADSADGERSERLVRLGPDGVVVLDLDGTRAPSGLAQLPGGDLVLCGFVSGTLERVSIRADGGLSVPGPDLGVPCATGVTVLADGSVVTTTRDAVVRAGPPAR